MSYVRFSEVSDVYVIGGVGYYECCSCSMEPVAYNFHCSKASEMIDHLREHQRTGGMVPDNPFVRLRGEIKEEEMDKIDHVRQKARWNLPRQLGLVSYAWTDYTETRRFGGQLFCEAWVPAWCYRISQLPVPIRERRRLLCSVMRCQKRRDALDALMDADTNCPNWIIESVAKEARNEEQM